jgi:hypothetical protein
MNRELDLQSEWIFETTPDADQRIEAAFEILLEGDETSFTEEEERITLNANN